MTPRSRPKDPYRRPPWPPTDLPFQVHSAGRVRDQPWHSTAGTYFDDVMVTVFVGGRGIYRRREAVPVAVVAGMIGVVPAEDPGLLMADPAEPYEHYYCRFNGAPAKRMAREILKQTGGERFTTRPEPVWREAAEIISRMGTVGKPVAAPERMTRADALLPQLLVTAAMEEEERAEKLDARALRNWFSRHLSMPADLEAVAREFGVSKSYLCRRARRELGTTLGDLFESMKTEWAGVLLRESSLRISEIARRVGYEDPCYFSRVFRKRTGLSPRAWRAREGKSPS